MRAAEPVIIRFGFANVGVDNRQFSGGTFIATAHAGHYIENELKDLPAVTVEYAFFKGAGPAVNEAFANGQLDFASQGDLPQIIARANGLKTRQLAAGGAHARCILRCCRIPISRLDQGPGRAARLRCFGIKQSSGGSEGLGGERNEEQEFQE